MGIYERDYERASGGGFGGGSFDKGGFGSWSTNAKLLVAIGVVYAAQLLFTPWFSELFGLHGGWYREPWRVFELLTYGFLHSERDLKHILFNAIAIFFFGRAIEMRYGSREYLWIFLSAVVFSGAVWSIANIAEGSPNALLVGASGGISALLLLFALNFPRQQVLIWGVLPVPAWLLAVLFIGMDVMGAVNRSGNVAYTAHLGGALFGFLYFKFGWRLTDLVGDGLKIPSFKRRPKLRVHREEPEPQANADDLKVDEILEKIQRHGQDSLTSKERKTLERASQRYKQRRP
ncbi:Rhomboid family protein [Pseudobythopirellula maris]|uniref:Rhomboid family protein n=1 Tax=Pseudobythopirellula maris TaxID=2527991 RepID=A0A5C5ZMI5_9BACT|nr:rhomboid family intramembrane serine protease [Pseudobythopirellula maris]TWT88197.1 Rhomboid family protein [Pseudobythopirellula maris]